MNEPPALRMPYEIWENILLELIAFVSPPFFTIWCNPSNYLAFKRTCGTGGAFTGSSNDYLEAEKQRVNLALVCRAWRVYAEACALGKRLICWVLNPRVQVDISDELWRGAQRIELGSSETYTYDVDGMGHLLSTWKRLGLGGNGMRVQRLEMMYSTERTFEGVFSALCEASSAMPCLRSLSLSVPTRNGLPFRRISKHFPDLVHLSVLSDYIRNREEDRDVINSDALDLRRLEALFLFPFLDMFKVTNWNLPALRHVYIHSGWGKWEDSFLPFLKGHSFIETLDLDQFNLTLTLGTATTYDFWNTFPNLELLRCGLRDAGFKSLPETNHPLRFFINTDVIWSEKKVVSALKPWLKTPGVKKLERIIISGPYLSSLEYKPSRYPVRDLVLGLQDLGTELLSPTGDSLIHF